MDLQRGSRAAGNSLSHEAAGRSQASPSGRALGAWISESPASARDSCDGARPPERVAAVRRWCPEIAADVSYEVIRSEPVVALVAATHPLVDREAIDLDELAKDEFLLFPRELAPRLYDFMVGLC